MQFPQQLSQFLIQILFFFLHAASDDCPVNFHRYSDAIDKLRSMIDIKSKITEDAINFRDQFPCNDAVLEFLEHFVSNAERHFVALSMNQFSICSFRFI